MILASSYTVHRVVGYCRSICSRLSPRVVIDIDVGLNEPHNSLLIKVIELVDPGPGGESDILIHARVGGQDGMVVTSSDLSQLFYQRPALLIRFRAIVVNQDSAVL